MEYHFKMIKKNFNLDQIKKFFKKKNFIVQKKPNIKSLNKNLKSLYFTTLASFVIGFAAVFFGMWMVK